MNKSELGRIKPLIENALKEDVGDGDITTNALIPDQMLTTATMVAKADGIIAGMEVAEAVFRTLSDQITWEPRISDGDTVRRGDLLVEMSGPFRALLTGERLALNFLQRMSGIATMTGLFVSQVQEFGTLILDTRKTVPGLRLLDKYAVKAGGGENHRIGLYDMVLIKDNHIKVAGGIRNAVSQVRLHAPAGMKIEVETTTMEEVREALEMKADIIMLDNFSMSDMKTAVKHTAGRALLEASGGIHAANLRTVAETGVDYISMGALTKDVRAIDLSMRFVD